MYVGIHAFISVLNITVIKRPDSCDPKRKILDLNFSDFSSKRWYLQFRTVWFSPSFFLRMVRSDYWLHSLTLSPQTLCMCMSFMGTCAQTVTHTNTVHTTACTHTYIPHSLTSTHAHMFSHTQLSHAPHCNSQDDFLLQGPASIWLSLFWKSLLSALSFLISALNTGMSAEIISPF